MWRRTKSTAFYFFPFFILLCYLGLWFCKFNQWDSLTYITIIPFWMWALLGTLASAITMTFMRSRLCVAVLILWLVTGLAISLEARGVFRQIVEPEAGDATEGALRLVSINCQDGSVSAAATALELKPDLLLLQEAPGREPIASLCQQLYGDGGSFVIDGSVAILGRGRFLTSAEEDEAPIAIHARFRHESGALMDVSNVALHCSIPEWQIWNKAVREQLRDTRIANRRALRRYIGEYPVNEHQPVRIIAGDFSTPPGDDIFRPLKQAGLRDAFATSGLGTGHTYPSERPFLRLDQVWISPDAQLIRTTTMESPDTDHRIVICEFKID